MNNNSSYTHATDIATHDYTYGSQLAIADRYAFWRPIGNAQPCSLAESWSIYNSRIHTSLRVAYNGNAILPYEGNNGNTG